jgi:hypothetical protein
MEGIDGGLCPFITYLIPQTTRSRRSRLTNFTITTSF